MQTEPGPGYRYTVLLAVASALSFAKTLLYAKAVSVVEFGVLGEILLVSTIFNASGSLGFHLLAHREMPVEYRSGREREALKWIAKAVIISTLTAIPALGMLTVAAAGFRMAIGSALLGIGHGWTYHAFTLVTAESKSRLEMISYSRSILNRVLATMIAGLACAYWLGSAASIALAEIGVTLLQMIPMVRASLSRVNVRILPLQPLRSMFTVQEWRAALILLAITAVSIVQVSADRWVASFTVSTQQFGIYSFAWITLSVAQVIQQIVNAGFFPFLARSAADGSKSRALRMAGTMSLIFLGVGVLGALLTKLFGGYLIRHFFARYADAEGILTPLVAAAILQLSDYWSTYLVVVKQEGLLLRGKGIAALGAVAAWSLMRLHPAFMSRDMLWQSAMLGLVMAVFSSIASVSCSLFGSRSTQAVSDS